MPILSNFPGGSGGGKIPDDDTNTLTPKIFYGYPTVQDWSELTFPGLGEFLQATPQSKLLGDYPAVYFLVSDTYSPGVGQAYHYVGHIARTTDDGFLYIAFDYALDSGFGRTMYEYLNGGDVMYRESLTDVDNLATKAYVEEYINSLGVAEGAEF